MQVSGLDHVQVAIPEHGEAQARAFYGGLLGLTEVAKPAALAGRGGCWFAGRGVSLHLGVERPFVAAGKAHVALAIDDLDAARMELERAGVRVTEDGLDVGFRRFYAADPFGNRLELVSRDQPARADGLISARGKFRISTDPGRLDLDWMVRALSERAYWALRRSRAAIAHSVDHSLCYGLYLEDQQVGVARVVTDEATFAWLCDVFIDEAWRGQGLGAWLIETIVADPRIATIRRFVLATRDAGELYRRHGGFGPLLNPERWMTRIND